MPQGKGQGPGRTKCRKATLVDLEDTGGSDWEGDEGYKNSSRLRVGVLEAACMGSMK